MVYSACQFAELTFISVSMNPIRKSWEKKIPFTTCANRHAEFFGLFVELSSAWNLRVLQLINAIDESLKRYYTHHEDYMMFFFKKNSVERFL